MIIIIIMATVLISALGMVPVAFSAYQQLNNARMINSLLNGDISGVVSNGLTGGTTVGSWFASAATQIGIMGAGTAAFVSLYGGNMYSSLSSTIHQGMHAEQKKKDNDRRGGGASDETATTMMMKESIARLHANRKIFIAGMVSIILHWLHYTGAAEMRKHMHRSARRTNTEGKLKPIDIERRNRWDRWQKNPDDDDDDDANDTDAAAAEEQPSSRLYAEVPYYVPDPDDVTRDGPYYLDPRHILSFNLMRSLLNVLIGIALQINIVFQGGGFDGDPLRGLTLICESLGLFEILCRALRQRGWSPTQNALLALQKLLVLPAAAAEPRPRRSAAKSRRTFI